MDNRKKVYATAVLGLILAGCGAREYQPAANTAAADIFAEACQSCHGPDGKGTEQLPRLAGQQKRYIVEQLQALNNGSRTNNHAVMHSIASKLTELEMQALAQYISGLN